MIGEYRSSDHDAVNVLFQRSVRGINDRDYSPAQIAAWASQTGWSRRVAHGRVFVCERDDEIAGFARIDEKGCIDLLYVDPDFQRQGVARELIDRVTSWALSRGIRRLSSEVSVTARPFFESAGFRLVREQAIEAPRHLVPKFSHGASH